MVRAGRDRCFLVIRVSMGVPSVGFSAEEGWSCGVPAGRNKCVGTGGAGYVAASPNRLRFGHYAGLSRVPTRVSANLVGIGGGPQCVLFCTAESVKESHPTSFKWLQFWYPVAVVKDLDPRRPHPLCLFGQELVAWRQTDGTWTVLEDSCPHRWNPATSLWRDTNSYSAIHSCSFHTHNCGDH